MYGSSGSHVRGNRSFTAFYNDYRQRYNESRPHSSLNYQTLD
ncbi:integrase core domain-containing protein [Pantoea ananatis]